MIYSDPQNMPFMLYADNNGQVFEHLYLRMAGFSGANPAVIKDEDLIQLPEFSKLFFIPGCPPMGFDLSTGRHRVVPQVDMHGATVSCNTVAAFLELARLEGILPALESAHALVQARKEAGAMDREQFIIVNMSGRGDKDCQQVERYLESHHDTGGLA